MSNELVKLDDLGGVVSKYDDDAWDDSASSDTFLPYIKLMTSNAKQCKSGEFPINDYALVQDQKHTPLGKNVDILNLDWRPKAMQTGDGVIVVHDPSDPEFQRIKKRADTVKNSGCMYGPEFLVWIPKAETFACFMMGSKSARREAGALKALLKKAATLGSQFCKNKEFEWYAPEVSTCNTPFDMPTKDALLVAIERFQNPPKNETETVEDTESRAR